MADSSFRGTSTVLLLVAVAATAGFLYWIYSQAQALDQQVTPQMADTASAEGSATVSPQMLAQNPSQAIGQDATLDSLDVGSSLGRGVFTLSIADTVEFPVLMGRELLQKGTTVYQGDQVSVRGQIFTLNDSIRSEWLSRGAVDSASAEQIPATAAFLLADSVDIQS